MNIFKGYCHFILSDYKWYRKKKGGTWYRIREFEVSGFAAASEYWIQKEPDPRFGEMIDKEDYENNN